MAKSGRPWAHHFAFVPQSYLFPAESNAFNQMIRSKAAPARSRYIVKPEFGALGARIRILAAGDVCDCNEYAVVQEYLEPKLSTKPGEVPVQTKFDFRIYVLIESVNPLKVHVYRDGLTRICAEQYGKDCDFAQLTNTAVNKKANVPIETLTKSMRKTLEQLYDPERQVRIWTTIKKTILLSVIAAAPYLGSVPAEAPPGVWESVRPFQILGFDIMIDKNDQPFILEVNYRPSLSRDTPLEETLKRDMFVDALRIMIKQPTDAVYTASWAKWHSFLRRENKRRSGFEEVPLDRDFHEILAQNLAQGCTWEPRKEFGANMPAMWSG
jgi:hypothetical protein